MAGFQSPPIRRILTVLSVLFVLSLSTAVSAFNVSTLRFDEAYTPLFGHHNGNLIRSSDDKSVRLVLDRYTGSGFASSDLYQHGLFSASIKLPSDYTAGVVVAFYTSNGDVFRDTHDELDFEFLGNVHGKPWRIQTNVYGNGSTSRGREERYLLWFDPTKEFHRYSILWTETHIIFYIDEVPIREVVRSDAMGGDYPSKPMAVYATLWDGSTWATSGGRYPVNYKYSPFVSEFSDLVLRGCRKDPIQQSPSAAAGDGCAASDAELAEAEYATITPERRQAMLKFRHKYMTYSYCYDARRYPVPFPECDVIPSERVRFRDTGNSNIVGIRHRRHVKRGRRVPAVGMGSNSQAAI
ncbi:putative xyloglucan endotransglucosylase/hydrolase protein 30 [Acorus calamus]|uniref:Xyloglucan endotransglucosylase/hydrolase n=1 Tax=Acorus calamus TaxID=4465 RepID=A0AAV9FLW9_ACOCL|nr:putative xyloglucan endotransglucosylase/hydrolase protein 30 [Acorus calamus]